MSFPGRACLSEALGSVFARVATLHRGCVIERVTALPLLPVTRYLMLEALRTPLSMLVTTFGIT